MRAFHCGDGDGDARVLAVGGMAGHGHRYGCQFVFVHIYGSNWIANHLYGITVVVAYLV